MKTRLSFVIPVYNEEEIIVDFYKQLSSVTSKIGQSFEIIFVTGGNTDGTLDILRKLNRENKYVKTINLSHRFDYQAALLAGIDYAEGEAIITMDGDLQHLPELIPSLIKEWEMGFDIVYTIRENSGHENTLKKIGSEIFYFLIGVFTRLNLDENAADFRLLSRKAADAFKRFPERKRYIPGIVSLLGFKRKGIKYVCPPRKKGKSKFSFCRMLAIALDGIFSFSNLPIRIVSVTGFIVTFLSFIYLIYVIVMRWLNPHISPGWASILAAILFLSSLQISILGLLGEYIGRIYEESKHRPIYLIDELVGFDKNA